MTDNSNQEGHLDKANSANVQAKLDSELEIKKVEELEQTPPHEEPKSEVVEDSKQEQKNSGSKALSVIAIIIALIGWGAVGYLYYLYTQKQVVADNIKSVDDGQSKLNQRIDSIVKVSNENTQHLQILQQDIERQGQLSSQINQIQAALTQTQDNLQSMQKSYQNQGGQHLDWLISELGYQLNAIEQQLVFSGNTVQAATALNTVLQHLDQLNIAQLSPIKQAINQDIIALQQIPNINFAMEAHKLGLLAEESMVLPLLADSTLSNIGSKKTLATDHSQQAWYNKLWGGIKNSLSQVVEVRHINSSDNLLLSPEQIYFVRQNIKLYLLDARVALNQRQDKIFHADLTAVLQDVEKYFDTKDTKTQQWISQLKTLQQLNLNIPSQQLMKNSLNAFNMLVKNGDNTINTSPSKELISSDTIATDAVVASSASLNQDDQGDK